MRQPIRRFDLWRRLYTRFTIEPLPATQSESPGILTEIVPTTNADELLTIHGAESNASIANNAGVSSVELAHTVPSGKRWKLFAAHMNRNTGDNLINRLVIRDVSGAITVLILLVTATTDLVYTAGDAIVLEETDQIFLGTDGSGVSASTYTSRIWRSEEDAF